MRKTALVIMAAGIGSRFGGGIKQLQPVGQNGEIIMDYSVHDAIAAGFNKIIFIIRREIESDFRAIIGDRIEGVCRELGVEVEYAFQDVRDIPSGAVFPEGRTKPWGTCHAVLAARELIGEPFAVLNADDYYGKEAFSRIHDFLVSHDGETEFCMAGFKLKNTLSDFGGVTRGICKTDADGRLTEIVETKNIVKTPSGAEANGIKLDPEAYSSMNMWGLTPSFVGMLGEGFERFFEDMSDELKSEFLLPEYIERLLGEGRISVDVLDTSDRWFGMTYKEDVPSVREAFSGLVASGVYQSDLFSDLGGN